MILKRSLSTFRSWILFLIQIFIPVASIIMAMLVAHNMDANTDLPNLPMTLTSYENPITVVNGYDNNTYYAKYVDMLKKEEMEVTDLGKNDLGEMIVRKTAEDVPLFRRYYIIGASFHSNKSITAWFNNEPYHSPALAFEYALNSIIAEEVGSGHAVHISNYPMPYTLKTKFENLQREGSLGLQLAFNISFSMAFVSAFYIIFLIKERVSNAKHLQFVSGVDIITFWGVSYVWDLLTFILSALFIILTIFVYQEDGYKTFNDLGRIFSVFLYFGVSVIPLTYLGSFLFNVPATGYTYMVMFNMFTGIMAFIVVQVLSLEELELTHVANLLHWIFLLLPQYSMSMGLRDLNIVYTTFTLCNEFTDQCIKLGKPNDGLYNVVTCPIVVCKSYKACCDVNEDYYSWEAPGIGRNVVFSVSVGIFLIALLLLIEFGFFGYVSYNVIEKLFKRKKTDEPNEDSDVLEEKQKIRQLLKDEIENYTLVLKNVTKYYKKFLAVDRLYLAVNKFECFGLVGVNGAGKTTTFKMMTGDVKITSGDIFINGMNLKKDMKQIYKLTGYCPQFDALLDNLTGKETLLIFALLRGFSYRDSQKVAEKLAKELDFYKHIEMKVYKYSGGNKRKLSTAVSLIGEPQIIYLDEPTTGMDPATKRHIWNSINKIRDSGKCVILTSHSMEECEALCTRLAIMVNGRFKCLGSTQHLKNKFSEGYTLTIKLRKTDDTIQDMELVENFIKENFDNAILRAKHQELLTYYIASTAKPWSKMFGIMETGKIKLNIEDYSLGQCGLDQVFLLITKTQREAR